MKRFRRLQSFEADLCELPCEADVVDLGGLRAQVGGEVQGEVVHGGEGDHLGEEEEGEEVEEREGGGGGGR